MATKNKGLGRGLGALIQGANDKNKPDYRLYPVDKIVPNKRQPRQTFNDKSIAALAESIEGVGIIEPLILSRDGDKFMLIAGERRLRAARLLGLKEVPAVLREVDGADLLYLAVIENYQREDLNPIELAAGLKLLIEADGASQEQAAKKLGMARPTLSNLLRLLTLPDEVRQLVADGVISAGHAKTLLALDDPADQLETARLMADEGLNVREAEKLVKDAAARRKKTVKTKAAADPELKSVAESLADRFGTKVDIKPRGKGGRIVIEYYSIAELNNLLDRFNKS